MVKDKPFLFYKDEMTPLDPSKVYEVIEKRIDKRSVVQNAAMWKYCSLMADSLNDAGADIETVLSKGTAKAEWTKDSFMDIVFRKITNVLFGHDSTTKISSNEITTIHKNVDKIIAERTGVSHAFPSQEAMIFEQNYKGK